MKCIKYLENKKDKLIINIIEQFFKTLLLQPVCHFIKVSRICLSIFLNYTLHL